jgi:hypothetical protein
MESQGSLMHKKEWRKAPLYLVQFSNMSGELEHTSLHFSVWVSITGDAKNARVLRCLHQAVAKNDY